MRLIDADALDVKLALEIKRITPIEESRDMFFHDSGINAAVVGAQLLVRAAPTIDAVPVVHGRWIHPEGYVVTNGFLCSECGNEEVSHRPIYPRPGGAYIADEHGNFFYPPDKKFCHNCGAKMDLEVEGDG